MGSSKLPLQGDIFVAYEAIWARFSASQFVPRARFAADGNRGFFPIMPNRPVRDQWEYPKKMERHFPIKPGQLIGMAIAIFHSFSEFPVCATNRFIEKWNGEFRSEYCNRNKCTTSRRDPEYSGWKKPKRTLPFKFRPNFPKSLAKWKHPEPWGHLVPRHLVDEICDRDYLWSHLGVERLNISQIAWCKMIPKWYLNVEGY